MNAASDQLYVGPWQWPTGGTLWAGRMVEVALPVVTLAETPVRGRLVWFHPPTQRTVVVPLQPGEAPLMRARSVVPFAGSWQVQAELALGTPADRATAWRRKAESRKGLSEADFQAAATLLRRRVDTGEAGEAAPQVFTWAKFLGAQGRDRAQRTRLLLSEAVAPHLVPPFEAAEALIVRGGSMEVRAPDAWICRGYRLDLAALPEADVAPLAALNKQLPRVAEMGFNLLWLEAEALPDLEPVALIAAVEAAGLSLGIEGTAEALQRLDPIWPSLPQRVRVPETLPCPLWRALPQRCPDQLHQAALEASRPGLQAAFLDAGWQLARSDWPVAEDAAEWQRWFGPVEARAQTCLWVNLPDRLPGQLAGRSRASWLRRYLLAATLAPSVGLCGPQFELMERRVNAQGRYPSTEVLNPDAPHRLNREISRINGLRASLTALDVTGRLAWVGTNNPHLLAYAVTTADHAGDALIVVNLTEREQMGQLRVPHGALGLPLNQAYRVRDLLDPRQPTYDWQGAEAFVHLDPRQQFAHAFAMERGNG